MSNMKRRDFLKVSAATAASLGVVSKAGAAQEDWADVFKPRSGYPCVQLFTDNQSAQFRVLAERTRALNYSAVDAKGEQLRLTILSRTKNPHLVTNHSLDHLIVEDLTPGLNYYLKIHDANTGELIDSREFSALDSSGSRRSTRFAMVSCMHDYMPTQAKMWRSLYEMKPEIILFLGDACYADFNTNGSPSDMWRRMFETRETLDVYYWKRLTPILATWDDHDFGGDNQNKNNPLRLDAFSAFKSMFGSADRPSIVQGPGVASIMTMFGQRFCLMDGRFFRDPKTTPDALHWGNEQENWLFDTLGSGTDPVWLMNGSQFFGAYLKKESFESDHPFQLERVLGRLADIPAPVVFGSGDVHFSELMKIESEHLGYETFEVTSSSMHSTTYPTMHRRAVNPRRIQGAVWQHNYILVDSDASTEGKMKFRARSIGMDRSLYFDRSFEVNR